MRAIATIHRWLGVTLAVFALLSAASGALLLWSDEYQRWRHPELSALTAPDEPHAVNLARVLDRASGPVGTIAMPRAALPAYQLYLRDGSQALHHPASGALISHWHRLDALPAFLFEAHVRLFAGELGHVVVGLLGVAFSVLAATGLATWWPRRRRMPLRGIVPRRASKLGLMKAHAAQGATTAALILFLGLSGAAIVFHGPVAAALNTLLGSSEVVRPTIDRAPSGGLEVAWSPVLAAAQRSFPDATLRFATLPREAGSPLILRLKQPGELHPNGRSYLVLHPATGAVLERIDATRTGAGPTVFDSLYPLHAGKTGWPGHRLILLVAGLAFTYLAGSGLLVFLRRRARLAHGRSESAGAPPASFPGS